MSAESIRAGDTSARRCRQKTSGCSRSRRQLLARVWVHGRHEVATALRTADGRYLHRCSPGGLLPTQLDLCRRGRDGRRPCGSRAGPRRCCIDTVVSVQIKPAGQFRIIAPCGVCRELISDYSPETKDLDHGRRRHHRRRRAGPAAPQDSPHAGRTHPALRNL